MVVRSVLTAIEMVADLYCALSIHTRYLDDEIADLLDRLDEDESQHVSYGSFLLKGSFLLQGYGSSSSDGGSVRSSMMSQLESVGLGMPSEQQAAFSLTPLPDLPTGVATGRVPFRGGGGRGNTPSGWGQIYVAVVGAAQLNVSAASASVAVSVALVSGSAPALDPSTSPSADHGDLEGMERMSSQLTNLRSKFVEHRRGQCEWNEDMQITVPFAFQGGSPTADPASLSVKVIEVDAAGASERVIGRVDIKLGEGEVFKALENGRHFDMPFRIGAPDARPTTQKGMPSKDVLQPADYR